LEGNQLQAAAFNALLERLLPVCYTFLGPATHKRIMREQLNLSSQTDDLRSQLGHPEILLVLIKLPLLLERPRLTERDEESDNHCGQAGNGTGPISHISPIC